MLHSPESDAQNSTESGQENQHSRRSEAIDNLGGPGKGFWQPKSMVPGTEPKPIPTYRWKDREDFVRTSIDTGLNADQISLLSTVTPQPFKHASQIYEYMEVRPKLEKLYYSKKTKAKRMGDHNRNIILCFLNLAGHAYRCGYPVSDVLRDRAPEGERFRPDLAMSIGGRLFFCEIQLSKIQQTRWREKMRQYLRYYEREKKPFRVLFLIQAGQINTLRAYARDVLQHHPALNLYYFMTLDQFRMTADVLHEKVWEGARSHAKHSLM